MTGTNDTGLLAVTMGDPSGCGPEIIAKAVGWPSAGQTGIVCIGDARVIQKAMALVEHPRPVRRIAQIEQATGDPGVLEVLDLHNVDTDRLAVGRVQASAGAAAFEYIACAIDLAMSNRVAAVVTAPISKKALHLAGHTYDGHTEILAARTGAKNVTMMLAAGEFRVTHVSTHCSIRQAVERCRTERILDVVRLTHAAVRQMGIAAPRLAVAGLNPHSGEDRLFGVEEREEIQPAIDAARAAGLNVAERPEPPDTVFLRMHETRAFDAVIAQYHDQGHIAAKLVDFWGGVNITLGLPIIRTSVDHGTAFDIAGTGRADPRSLINAIAYARRMTSHRE